eukprot:gene4290-biopygen6894
MLLDPHGFVQIRTDFAEYYGALRSVTEYYRVCQNANPSGPQRVQGVSQGDASNSPHLTNPPFGCGDGSDWLGNDGAGIVRGKWCGKSGAGDFDAPPRVARMCTVNFITSKHGNVSQSCPGGRVGRGRASRAPSSLGGQTTCEIGGARAR